MPLVAWVLRHAHRMLLGAAFILLVGLVIYTGVAPVELALMFAGDTLVWLEAALTVALVAQVTRVAPVVRYTRIVIVDRITRLAARARRTARPRRVLPEEADEVDRGLALA